MYFFFRENQVHRISHEKLVLKCIILYLWLKKKSLQMFNLQGFTSFTIALSRRERDSNPRYSCPYTAFRVRPDRPLRHLSKIAAKQGSPRPSGPVGSDVYHPFGAANINKNSQIILFHDKKVVRKRKFAPRTHRSVQYPRPARVYMNETGRLSKIIPTFVRKPFRY